MSTNPNLAGGMPCVLVWREQVVFCAALPSFINLACLPKLCEGVLLSDVIAINASVDIVMGEIDR